MSNANLETALNTLKFLHPDGGVFELCLINPLVPTSPNWKGKAFGKKPLVAGWFRDQSKAVNLATRNDAEGIYTTLNQVNEALLARADHKLKANVDRTADDHIDRIQNLLYQIRFLLQQIAAMAEFHKTCWYQVCQMLNQGIH
jgi:hypothetical protein